MDPRCETAEESCVESCSEKVPMVDQVSETAELTCGDVSSVDPGYETMEEPCVGLRRWRYLRSIHGLRRLRSLV